MDQALLLKLREVVEANIDNEQFSVEDLAASVAYSRSHLHRKLRELTGRSISQFIRTIRLERGMELLKGEVGTVSEISFRVGFGSSTYFIKCFSEEFGFSPGEVKRKVAEGWFEQTTESTDAPSVSEAPAGETDGTGTVRPPVSTPLELLHPSASESLIREIFEALVIYKPSLEKFLAVDEEEGETVDIRLLAYQIIKSYPWPIGVELRRLFSAALKEQGMDRYRQLQKTITRVLKILSFILASELTLGIFDKKLIIDEADKKSFGRIFGSLDPPHLVEFLRLGHAALDRMDQPVFVTELKEAFEPSFFLELKDWLELSSSPVEEMDADRLVELNQGLEQTLILLLKKTAFLAGYRMVNVSSIRVRKPKFKKALFEHRFHLLNSSDSDFRTHDETAAAYADSNAILLLKSIRETSRFLNLSPLLIDTHNEDISNNERGGMKRDIFLFERYDGQKLFYSGTEYAGTDELSQLADYEELLASYTGMINLMTK